MSLPRTLLSSFRSLLLFSPRTAAEREFSDKVGLYGDLSFARSTLSACSNDKEKKRLANLVLIDTSWPLLHWNVGGNCFELTGEIKKKNWDLLKLFSCWIKEEKNNVDFFICTKFTHNKSNQERPSHLCSRKSHRITYFKMGCYLKKTE